MWDSEGAVDQIVKDHDQTRFPTPSIESEPHLLISKVRKHYMEYLIKLLTQNYETNQRLLNKNLYLPSAIWRCAKGIEMKAAQACMVVQLYRANILATIEELKTDTKNRKLNKVLYECLHWPPQNEKKLQTTSKFRDCACQCTCNKRKRHRKVSELTPRAPTHEPPVDLNSLQTDADGHKESINADSRKLADPFPKVLLTATPITNENHHDNSPKLVEPERLVDSHSQDSDELMSQLEKLFQGDPNDDDLFDVAFGDIVDSSMCENVKQNNGTCQTSAGQNQSSSIIENHSAQLKSLDARLASLTGLLIQSTDNNQTSQRSADVGKPKKFGSSKWLCEEYFLKAKLFQLLDEIGDCNRKKLERIKDMFYELFEDDDSIREGVMSPPDQTTEFIISCKERIAPWVVKILTPYYVRGRIKGKALFKSVAKHLIRLIYQCSHYPHKDEVHSFVTDFLTSHKTIRCEADFKEFKINM